MQISNCVNLNISEVRKQATNQKTKQEKKPKYGKQRSYYLEKPPNKQNTTQIPNVGQQRSYYCYIAHRQQSRTGHMDIWAMHGGPHR